MKTLEAVLQPKSGETKKKDAISGFGPIATDGGAQILSPLSEHSRHR